MTTTPAQSKQAHNAIGDYRHALDEAERHAKGLAEAAQRAGQAAAKLQGYVASPIPAVEWRGAPPVAEWRAGLETLIPAIKAGLAA